MKRNNLLTGALILSVGGVLSKIFSAVYRIALTRILGGEGIGIYQLVFPFYSLLVVLATAGLPLAISKVISKHKESEGKILKKCLVLTSVFSLVLTLILLLLSKTIASFQGKPEITICYILLAPTIIIVSVASVLRGYFQGRQNFTPSAVSNILEQFIKLALGLTLSLALVKISLMASIIGAMVSIVVSEIVSIIVLLIYFKKREINNNSSVEIKTKEILKDVLPITLTSIIMPIASFVDSLIVVNLLVNNFSRGAAIYLYGLESGAVSNLISLPTIFSFAIASVLLPNISGAKVGYNQNHKLTIALKIVMIICVPCVLCFLLVPEKLIYLLYGNKLDGYGFNGLVVARQLLTLSGLGVAFLSVNQLYSSCLQAVDKRGATVRNLSIAVVIKFALEILFLPTKINIYALAISNTICYLTAMLLNHVEMREVFKMKLDFIFIAKLIVCNSLLLLSLLIMLNVGNSAINILTAIMVSGVVYLTSLYAIKIFTNKDTAMLKYRKH